MKSNLKKMFASALALSVLSIKQPMFLRVARCRLNTTR